jgi:hypothetical protein
LTPGVGRGKGVTMEIEYAQTRSEPDTTRAAEKGSVVFVDVLDRYLDGKAGSGVPAGERT